MLVGSYLQTYCKSCGIRWFTIEKNTKDPNTGIFVFGGMKEDTLFNKLYEEKIEELYKQYF